MLIFIIIILIYFAPLIIASFRKGTQINQILVINLFLGWTFIGWVIALVMAVKETKK